MSASSGSVRDSHLTKADGGEQSDGAAGEADDELPSGIGQCGQPVLER